MHGLACKLTAGLSTNGLCHILLYGFKVGFAVGARLSEWARLGHHQASAHTPQEVDDPTAAIPTAVIKTCAIALNDYSVFVGQCSV
jgi:hypothetical protein